MSNNTKSRPPGEQFAELERILGGGSMDDIRIGVVSGKHDGMTREEFDGLYKERVAVFVDSKAAAA